MSQPAFESAVAEAARVLGATRARTLADRLARGRSRDYILDTLHVPEAEDSVRRLLDAAERAGIDGRESAAHLRGFVAGWVAGRSEVDVRAVWSGPATHAVPSRATAQALVEVVREAEAELILMTYSARAYAPLTQALIAARARGVRVDVVVETREGSGGLLAGAEPAQAFASVPGIRLWHWPTGQRLDSGARQHAKVAVADARTLLVSSANLTASGARRNIEAGLLVRGGTVPERVAEHVRELQQRGVLRELPSASPFGHTPQRG